MKKRLKRISIPLLLIAIAAAIALWQWRSARALADELSALREGAYYSAVDALANMQTDLSKVFIASTPGRHALLLGRVSSLAFGAAENLSGLPAAHGAGEDGIKFLTQTADYASTLATAAADGRALSDDDLARLAILQEKCGELRAHLSRGVGFDFDVKLDARESAGIEYPSLLYDGPFSDGRRLSAPVGLPEGDVTAEEALEIVRNFLGAERVRSVSRAADAGGPIPAFGVTAELEGLTLTAEVTVKGGKILWMSPETADFEARLPLDECALHARAFLTARGFGEMRTSYYQQYNGLAVVSLVAVQEDVLLYPDLVKAQVRMDTGEVVGLEASHYWTNHRRREALAPALEEAEARERVSSRLGIDSARLCVIPLDDGLGTGETEALCWEFGGTWSENRYLVYIDALSGEEREVLMLVEEDGGVLTI